VRRSPGDWQGREVLLTMDDDDASYTTRHRLRPVRCAATIHRPAPDHHTVRRSWSGGLVRRRGRARSGLMEPTQRRLRGRHAAW